MEPITTNASELGNSVDLLAQRQQELLVLIRQTAPEVISDNQIDIQALKVLLGEESIAPAEHYELSWAGKSAARREIQKTSSHTLLPAADNPERATHMLIEGENLEVLRVLQKSYYGKVKMIYIDPPYNTGNDSFVYPDDYSETLDEYQKRTGEKNEAGFLNKHSLWKKNSKESGQYHSAWLSMMYPRLYLARNLLRDDGVIFLSIDDNEAANLKLLCDEIFGAENFVGQLIWRRRVSSAMANNNVSSDHEYVICFKKNKINGFVGMQKDFKKYANPDADPRGDWISDNLTVGMNASMRPNQAYDLVDPSTGNTFSFNPNRVWAYAPESMARLVKEGRIIFPTDIGKRPMLKRFKNELKSDNNPFSSLMLDWVGLNTEATKLLQNLMGGAIFDYSKPMSLLTHLIKQITLDDDLIFDFFAGSGTTAQAVMELNLEDGGNRQCICVQMPEVLEETSEAYKAGYRTIAEITRARIEKVIAKLKAEAPDKTVDLACANFTLAPSNFKVWRSELADAVALREQLALFQSAEKNNNAHREADTQTAMLTELLLKHGLGALGVHANARPLKVAGVTIHRVQMHHDAALWLCFEPYTDELKDEITKAKPAQVILLNSCFASDKADEQISNLQLELDELDIRLTII